MNFSVQHVITHILEKQIEILTPVFKSILTHTESLVYNHLLEFAHFSYVVIQHSNNHPVTIH